MRLAFKSKPYFLFVEGNEKKEDQYWDGRKLNYKFEKCKRYSTVLIADRALTAIQKNAFHPTAIKRLVIGMQVNNKLQGVLKK